MQFLQRLSVCFGKEEVDEDDLKTQPDDVHNQILPVSIFETNRIYKRAWVVSRSFGLEKGWRDIPNMTDMRPKS